MKWRWALALLMACSLSAGPAAAQSRLFGPSGREDFGAPPLEDAPDESRPDRGRILPRIELPTEETVDAMRAGRAFRIERFEIRGAERLRPDELAALTAPLTGRVVYYSEIESLRAQITEAYRTQGFVAAGARIPDQTLRDGVFVLEVVEGRLVDLEIRGEGRLPVSRYEVQLRNGAGDVPNVFRIEEALQILQSDPAIERVDAQLLPEGPPGDARLAVTIVEATPWRASAGYSNHTNPAIGEHGADLGVGHVNLFGFGDELALDGRITEGLLLLDGRYRIPVNAYGTRVGFDLRLNRAEIIDEGFQDLDITSRSETVGLVVEQGLYRSLQTSASAFVSAEYRGAETRLRDETIPLGSDAEPKLTVLRGGGQLQYRSRQRVFAARGVVSWGIDALGATGPGRAGADARFVSGLLQLQAAERLPFGIQAILRADAQLAASRLLPLERFALGGASTVRGYRENELLRDNGVLASFELRAPLYRRADGAFEVGASVFTDFARGWDRGPRTRGKNLWSAGVGLRSRLWGRIELEGLWARTLQVETSDLESSLQDHGFHLRATVRFP